MTVSETIRVAAVQLHSGEDVTANLASAERWVGAAVADGAALVVLPEKFACLGSAEAMRAAAEPLDGPVGRWAAGLAAAHGIWLVAGSVLERADGAELPFNTSVLYAPDGRVAAVYRKVHLFDVSVDGVAYEESAVNAAGEVAGVQAALSDGCSLGLSVCYDLRFPELFRAVAGVELLAVPAAFTLATTRDHWEVLLRARAIENQACVIGANQIGEHVPGQRSGGRSMIVDPWGVVLGVAPDRPGAVLADLSLADLQAVRTRLPALVHRRPAGFYAGADVTPARAAGA